MDNNTRITLANEARRQQAAQRLEGLRGRQNLLGELAQVVATLSRDTAQEVGTSLGTAVVGTLIAVMVTAVLPGGVWSADLVASYFHGERVLFTVLAIAVGLIAGLGAATLTSSRDVDEH